MCQLPLLDDCIGTQTRVIAIWMLNTNAAGLDEKFAQVKKSLKWGLSVVETVNLTGISMSSVKRYWKQIVRHGD